MGGTASIDDAPGLFRVISQPANIAMNASAHVISHMSIFIFSYFLVHAGVSNRLPPEPSVNCVLIGTIGFIAYFAFEWSARLRGEAARGKCVLRS